MARLLVDRTSNAHTLFIQFMSVTMLIVYIIPGHKRLFFFYLHALFNEFKESGNVPILSEDMPLCKFYIFYSFALFISTFSIVDRMNAQLDDYLYLLWFAVVNFCFVVNEKMLICLTHGMWITVCTAVVETIIIWVFLLFVARLVYMPFQAKTELKFASLRWCNMYKSSDSMPFELSEIRKNQLNGKKSWQNRICGRFFMRRISISVYCWMNIYTILQFFFLCFWICTLYVLPMIQCQSADVYQTQNVVIFLSIWPFILLHSVFMFHSGVRRVNCNRINCHKHP